MDFKKRDLQKYVHAQAAIWSPVYGENHVIVGYEGRFPMSEYGAAMGTARHFFHSHITTELLIPKVINARHVLRITDKNGLEKFEHFAIDHGLLEPKNIRTLMPDLDADELLIEDHGTPSAKPHLTFKPTPSAIGKKLVELTEWKKMGEFPANHENLVFSTQSPLIAFQVALYLNNHGWIDKKKFWQINDQAAEPRPLGTSTLITIAINDAKSIKEFLENFPEAQTAKEPMEATSLLRTIERQSGITNQMAI